MRISTSEFLLGTLNSVLSQESTVNQLNQEISSGQSLTDATTDPASAGLVIQVASQMAQLTYDTSNAQSGAQSIQSGLSALQQVTNLISQMSQTAEQAANGTTTPESRQALVSVAQGALQELVQLANTQGPNGSYLFAGSKASTEPFQVLSSGQVVYSGDGGANALEIAPSLTVPVSVSGQNIFMNIADGNGSFSVAASGSNTGQAVATAAGVTSASQITAERLAGTQYDISFASPGGAGGLTYTVTSGSGAPGSAGFSASSGVVASGSFTAGSDLLFAGMDVRVTGTPAAGDTFVAGPSQNASIFQTFQNLITALQLPQSTAGTTAVAQQQIENVLGNLAQAQTGILLTQASLGANLSEIQSVQGQDGTMNTSAQAELSNLQSANLPDVMARYSEGVTALQAAELAFGKIQGLSLFSVIGA